MSNPIKLPINFTSFDFVAMAKKESNARNHLRLIAMANIKEGKTLQEISTSLKIHWKTIQTWLSKFRTGGIDNLYVKTKKIKSRKINAKIDSWIKKFMEALNISDEGGYITGKQLHKFIEKEFSINLCLRSIYNALHRLNYSWITSRSKHPKSDKDIQEVYKKLSKLA